MANPKASIELPPDHALILLDWIRRLNEREDVMYEDQAEQRVLWDLEASLEKALTAPLEADYQVQLRAARDRVRDRA